MKPLLRIVGGLVAVVLLLFGVGVFLPAGHVATVETVYTTDVDTVWGTISDFEHVGEWSRDIDRMERRPDVGGREHWVATGAMGALPTTVLERVAPTRLVTEVDGGVFRGTWTYELEPAETGTRLRITERGEISIPIFRYFSLFHDAEATMVAYTIDLGRHLGEEVTPEGR